jgi:2C-methyl-D-erythritol 2,4-cyclodiphosphate synthase
MIVAGWTLVVCGLSIACSQVPTLHPDIGVLALGVLVALLGGLLIGDRGARGRDR